MEETLCVRWMAGLQELELIRHEDKYLICFSRYKSRDAQQFQSKKVSGGPGLDKLLSETPHNRCIRRVPKPIPHNLEVTT